MTNNSHIPVLLKEAIEGLNIKPNGVYLDCTYGRGGHSREILNLLGLKGRLIAMDKDLDAIKEAKKIKDKRFEIEHCSFTDIELVLEKKKIKQLDGILMDLGISSPQIDKSARGFSFQSDGPLDMRMNQSQGITAADIVNNYEPKDLVKEIGPKNPATKTFQALRIMVNREIDEVEETLPLAFKHLKLNGRLVVISFHSLEDRAVKNYAKFKLKTDIVPKYIPIKASEIKESPLKIIGKLVIPSKGESQKNPRSRSAKLRILEKVLELA
jgi:16S rRNA (cytosine1402-N4)-methyltransferase